MKKAIYMLDCFCGAGGAAKGYFEAAKELGINIEIIGIDIKPQKHYPYQFIQGDAIEYIRMSGHKFDFIHGSPPCQHASKSTVRYKKEGKIYPDYIPAFEQELLRYKVPSVIENVLGAKLRTDIILSGPMFNLQVIRRRIFQINHFMLLQSPEMPKNGSIKTGEYCSIYGKGGWSKCGSRLKPKFAEKTVRETWMKAMSIDWYMNEKELSQAIPPAYTKYIGLQIFKTFL